MKALDSNPEPLPNFDTLAPIADMDEESESDDGRVSNKPAHTQDRPALSF